MMKTDYSTFGEYLKENRLRCGLSASEVAKRIGVSRAEISRIESGDRKEPSLKILRSVSILFGDDLVKVTDMIIGGKPNVSKVKVKKVEA